MVLNTSEPTAPYYGIVGCSNVPDKLTLPFGNFQVGRLTEKMTIEWQQAENVNVTYGVPQGCVVRNTFLEWNGVPDQHDDSGEMKLPIFSERPLRSLQRSKSSPEQFWYPVQGLPSSLLYDKEVVQGKFLTADTLQALGDTETSPGASGINGSNGSFDESGSKEDSEDMPIEPWSSKGQQDYSEQGKWSSSPTSFSGRSPKSRRERDFGFDGKQSKSGSTRAREFERDAGGGSKNNVLTLRGLPFVTTEAEVYDFVLEAGCKQWLAPISRPICLLNNLQGRPSGYAEIHLARASDFHLVRTALHMQYFGQRYVEVLPQRQGAPAGSHSGARSDYYETERRGDRRDRDRGGRSWRRGS
jgi:hypothetical protein